MKVDSDQHLRSADHRVMMAYMEYEVDTCDIHKVKVLMHRFNRILSVYKHKCGYSFDRTSTLVVNQVGINMQSSTVSG